MENAKIKIEAMSLTVQLCEGLRNWQKRSVERRCSLEKLAQNLNTTRERLRQLMTKGPRKAMRKAESKKNLVVAIKTANKPKNWHKHRSQTSKVYRKCSESSKNGVLVSLPHARKMVRPIVAVRNARRGRQKRALKRDATPISASQLCGLAFSQRSW